MAQATNRFRVERIEGVLFEFGTTLSTGFALRIRLAISAFMGKYSRTRSIKFRSATTFSLRSQFRSGHGLTSGI
jgi:hypothetical protein